MLEGVRKMRGVHDVVVRNNKVQIKLTVSRNLTILQGKSATGKTTLLELIAAYDELGANSGVVINCDVPCKILAGRNWLRDLSFIENSIVFIDEESVSCRSSKIQLSFLMRATSLSTRKTLLKPLTGRPTILF